MRGRTWEEWGPPEHLLSGACPSDPRPARFRLRPSGDCGRTHKNYRDAGPSAGAGRAGGAKALGTQTVDVPIHGGALVAGCLGLGALLAGVTDTGHWEKERWEGRCSLWTRAPRAERGPKR